jgi:YD repeat-containing protein
VWTVGPWAAPGAQEPPPSIARSGSSCRTYSADEVRTYSTSPSRGSGSIKQTCHFDRAANQRTCTQRHSGDAGTYTVVLVDAYESAAGFVEEVSVVPPIARVLSGQRRFSGTPAPDADLTFSYDAQRRQTHLVTRMSNGMTQTLTYTAWDPAGRPTVAVAGAPGGGFQLAYAYDDAERTMTIRGPAGVQTHTYDANGNLIHEVAVAAGNTVTYAITLDRTETICR